MKIIGEKKNFSALECLLQQQKLIAEMEKLRPYQKPKGIILKFKTWGELESFNLERVSQKM